MWDVFLSHKHDSDGAALADHLYDALTQRGLKVFLSTKSLPSINENAYAETITKILERVPVVVCVAAQLEDFESTWARFEWTSYHTNRILAGDRRGALISYVDDIAPDDLPYVLRTFQSIQHGSDSADRLFQCISARLGLETSKRIADSAEAALARMERLMHLTAKTRVIEIKLWGEYVAAYSSFLPIKTQDIQTLANLAEELEEFINENPPDSDETL